MKAMVLAAGLGTRLKPLTFHAPKPMVPVLDRPVMAHIVGLLESQGFDELVANLHWHADAIRAYFGDRLTWSYEPELLGTAGGVRKVRDFFGEEPIVVISGDALTDLDLRQLVARHRETGGIATLTVKRIPDPSKYGVVLHDRDGRITGFQEKPDPAEALSNLASCGIYCFSPEIFDYFPEREFVDWAQDVFPVLLENDVPFYVHEIDSYWNDIGSLGELKQGTWDALEGRVQVERRGHEVAEGVFVCGDAEVLDGVEVISGPIWIGAGCELGEGVRLIGPVVLGDGTFVGAGSSLRSTIALPGTRIEPHSILIDAIVAADGFVERLPSLDALSASGSAHTN